MTTGEKIVIWLLVAFCAVYMTGRIYYVSTGKIKTKGQRISDLEAEVEKLKQNPTPRPESP